MPSRQSSEWLDALRAIWLLFDRPAPSSYVKVPWTHILKVAELVSKQATTTGLLFCGDPTVIEQAVKIESYLNELQNFVLLCFASTVGAGPTLLSVVRDLCFKVESASFELLDASAEIQTQAARQEALPALCGCVWQACDALKTAPSDNKTAVGRAIIQVGTSINDVLRELIEAEAKETRRDDEQRNDSFDLDVSCSEAEKVVLGKVRDYVAAVLDVTTQVLYVVTKASSDDFKKLEAVLEHSRVIGREVDGLAASSMPPQEVEQLKERAATVDQSVGRLTRDLTSLSPDGVLPQALLSECEKASSRLSDLQDELVDAVNDEMKTLTI